MYKKNGKGNTPCVRKGLRANRDVTEFNDCDKADEFRGKKMEDQVDYFHQERSREESRLRLDLCETEVADLTFRHRASSM